MPSTTVRQRRIWTRPTQIDLARWPNLAAFHKRVSARPKVQEALQAEGLLKKAA